MGGRRASDVGVEGELTNSLTIKKDDEAFKLNKPDKRTTNAQATMQNPMDLLKFNSKKRKTHVPILSELTDEGEDKKIPSNINKKM